MSNAADKRSVHTDALETLGTIIDASAARDAIHLAVEPVIAAHNLYAGDHVGFIDVEKKTVGRCDKPLGIVDPFLKDIVKAGQQFWLVVYPRQITSLRHVWAHPDFPDPDPKPEVEMEWHDESNAFIPKDQLAVFKALRTTAGEDWIRNYADGIGVTFDVLMNGAKDWVDSRRNGNYGDYLCIGGLLEGVSLPKEFWKHYQEVTGDNVESQHRESFFTCSC